MINGTVLFAIILYAALALWLLYRDGLIRKPWIAVLCAVLVAAALAARASVFDMQTGDYRDWLARWMSYYRENGGFKAFKELPPYCNYHVPYLYFLALFSYLRVPELYLIKLLSVLFDILLAWAVMKLCGRMTGNRGLRLCAFFAALFWPTVFLNSAVWGQCDSIYVAFALLGLWLGLTDRPILSMLCFTLSFGFKLQAVFLMPIMAVLWFRGNYKLWHFALFPVFYVLLVLPAVLLGKPFMDTITLYASQTGSIGSGLNYNSPSVYAFFWRSPETQDAANLGIVAAFTYMAALLLFCFFRRKMLNERAVLAAALLFAVGIPFFLPHMHERYFFAADVLSVVLGSACILCIPAAALTQFASLLGYYAYLNMRYLLYVDHGARALIVVMVLAFIQLLYETADHGISENLSNSKKQP